MRIVLHKIFLFEMLLLVLTGCGGRAINKKNAQDIIAERGLLKGKDVDIASVSQTGSGQVIVRAKLPVAFHLEKVRGKWEIREVRIGEGQWEKVDDFVAALREVKIAETRDMLEKIAAAIDLYRERNGRLPEFKDYVTLSDALAPDYLNPLIRLDAWRNPLVAIRTAPATVQLLSAGPDGQTGTSDDIVLTRTYPPK